MIILPSSMLWLHVELAVDADSGSDRRSGGDGGDDDSIKSKRKARLISDKRDFKVLLTLMFLTQNLIRFSFFFFLVLSYRVFKHFCFVCYSGPHKECRVRPAIKHRKLRRRLSVYRRSVLLEPVWECSEKPWNQRRWFRIVSCSLFPMETKRRKEQSVFCKVFWRTIRHQGGRSVGRPVDQSIRKRTYI